MRELGIEKDKKTLSKERLVLCTMILYMFPYASVLMYLPEQNDRFIFVLGFVLILAVNAALALAARVYGSIYMVLIGNLVSTVSAYFFLLRLPATSQWSAFFEPLQPSQAIWIYVGLLLIPQIIALIGFVLSTNIKSQKPGL